MKKGVWFILLFTFSTSIRLVYSKTADALNAIHLEDNRKELAKYKEQAESFCAKNLNRFGLYELQKYDAALDSLAKQELNDTLNSFKMSYEKAHLSRNESLASLNSQISALSKQKEEAQRKFNALLKKAGIASAIWLLIVVILIQIRSRTLKRIESKLNHSKLQLQFSQQNVELGKNLLEFVKSNQEPMQVFQTLKADIQASLTMENEKAEEVKSILAAGSGNEKLMAAITSLETQDGAEKISSQLNQLCDQCMDTVYYGVNPKDEATQCVITKDLEKNLPSIKIIPEAVNYLLLNVLNNAFHSVYEKQEKGVKGYVPKVSISTRVLPRFLQIRIKDNGSGMKDEEISKIHDPFYTMKDSGKEAGLGMYFSKRIITEMHKGEIKIESQVGDGTDVYLKFFTD